MVSSDLPDMQQDFLTRMTESWSRLSSAWTDAVKGLHVEPAHSGYNSVGHGWMNPWAFQSVVKSPSTASRFQEMIDSAARDLPELLMHGSDKGTVNDIKDKWLRSYRNFVGEMLGIPRQSEAMRLVDRWRTFFRSFSGSGSGFRGGLFPDFSAMIASMEPFLEPKSGSMGFNIWTQSYEMMFDRLFRFPGGSLTREWEDRFNRAMETQTRFLNALPEFQEQIVSAAGKGLEKVIGRIVSLGVEQLSPETYQEFHRVWISTHEEAMVRLFRSDAFSKAILDTIQSGIDAKKEMEGLIASGFSPWSVPIKEDLDAVNEEVRALIDHVGKLEDEIRALKVELIRIREARSYRSHRTEELP